MENFPSSIKYTPANNLVSVPDLYKAACGIRDRLRRLQVFCDSYYTCGRLLAAGGVCCGLSQAKSPKTVLKTSNRILLFFAWSVSVVVDLSQTEWEYGFHVMIFAPSAYSIPQQKSGFVWEEKLRIRIARWFISTKRTPLADQFQREIRQMAYNLLHLECFVDGKLAISRFDFNRIWHTLKCLPRKIHPYGSTNSSKRVQILSSCTRWFALISVLLLLSPLSWRVDIPAELFGTGRFLVCMLLLIFMEIGLDSPKVSFPAKLSFFSLSSSAQEYSTMGLQLFTSKILESHFTRRLMFKA